LVAVSALENGFVLQGNMAEIQHESPSSCVFPEASPKHSRFCVGSNQSLFCRCPVKGFDHNLDAAELLSCEHKAGLGESKNELLASFAVPALDQVR